MNVLLIGSGGREHALALKISESKSLSKLYISPGNPGTLSLGENVNLDVKNHSEMENFCQDKNIELVVVGPEQPLVDGLTDFLLSKNIKVFGPSQNAAQIEGDKSFSKELMKKYNIPTAAFEVFANNEYEKAVEYVSNGKFPVVIKASGLAAGKGVLICEDKNSALEALEDCFNNKVFGEAGDKVVIEEFMVGQEASLFAITDGQNFVSLPVSQDHKRIGEGDTGLNTGGMGAYAPAPVMTDELLDISEKTIIQPTLDAMKKEDKTFVGCLYCGLMLTAEGPKVVEFNCRFGDPETQAVLPLLEGDFLELLYSAAAGNINKDAVKYNGKTSVCVIAASKGYPGSYEKGFEIKGLESNSDKEIIVYHAGTKAQDDKIVTSGGRVLGVNATISGDLKSCKEKAYSGLKQICFEGIYYRNDIADKAIK